MSDVQGNGKTARWQLWLAAASVGVLIVAPALTFFTQIIGLQGEVAQQANQLKDLKETIVTIQANQATDRLDITRARSALNEVETQFCSADDVRNLLIQHLDSDLKTVWEHAKLGEYPDKTLYPKNCHQTQDVLR